MQLRIVVPLDGSALAEAALPWARLLAERNAAEVALVSVLEVPTEFAAWATAERLETADVYDARRTYLERLAARYSLDDALIQLRVGAPAREIIDVASTEADIQHLIVMSTHGYGGFKRLAFGSVALQVIHGFTGPLMTVRQDAPADAPRLNRLLIPVDGSEYSARAIERALGLSGKPYPQLHLVRVLGTPAWAVRSIEHGLVAQYLAASRELAHQQLDDLRDRTAAEGYAVTSELRPHGDVVEEIIAAAEGSRSDAIAMCTHGLGGVGRIVLGSVADGVLSRSSRPVLLLRPQLDG